MIDPKLLRQSAADVAANLAGRGFEFDADGYLALEERRKSLQVETERLQSERNSSAKSIGKAKAQGEDIEPLLAAVKQLGERLEASEAALQEVQAELRDIELGLPNLLADDVPDGQHRGRQHRSAALGRADRSWLSRRAITSNLASGSGNSISMRPAAFRARASSS